jgi:BirA family biotin operon repressor/biotin-[acetyl-CoA-carboxylase] ligase
LFVGHSVIRLESVNSTNTYAADQLIKSRPPEGIAYVAAEQTQGRGYSGNEWKSEKGKNLLLSVVLYPVFLTPRQHFFLNQVASLAIAETLQPRLPGREVKIKWPNDVFIGDKKVAGILIENSVKGNLIQHSIIGMGINVNQREFDPELKRATSLLRESKQVLSLDEIMLELFVQLEKRYLQLKEKKMEVLARDYMKRLYRVDEAATFLSQGKIFSGKIEGITAEGKLVIEHGGAHHVYGFKEVEFVME